MKTLIFSDAHLNATQDSAEQRAAFVSFLRKIDAKQVDCIIILGDLFDFWFEYQQVIFSGYFDVLRALADLADKGVAFHFVCGNHDFWVGRFLREQLRFMIHYDPVLMDFGNKRTLLVHGDGLNPGDWGYRFFKWFARARPVVFAFRSIHPDWAMRIAQCVSRGSRRLSRVDDLSHGPDVEPQRAFAKRTLAAGDADVVVCGHSHYPVRETHPTPEGPGLYVNVGDWLYHQSYVVWDGTDFQLHSFNHESEVVPPRETSGAE